MSECPSRYRASVFGEEAMRRQILRWHRVTAFQMATLLEMAEQIVAALPKVIEYPCLHLKSEKPTAPRAKMVIYVSANVSPRLERLPPPATEPTLPLLALVSSSRRVCLLSRCVHDRMCRTLGGWSACVSSSPRT